MATFLVGRTSQLVVSFTGVGKSRARRQAEEFVASSRQDGRNHVLFIADTLRSWYNDPGIYEEILEVIDRYRQEHRIERVATFGNSMGGYGAVLFAGALGAQSCLAISAQVSADPTVVPEERRWRGYRDRITVFTCPPLEKVLRPDCRYFVLHGGGKTEKSHWSRFPRAPYLHHYLVGHAGHGVGRRLKAARIMERVSDLAIAGRPVAFRRALVELGGVRKRPLPEPVSPVPTEV